MSFTCIVSIWKGIPEVINVGYILKGRSSFINGGRERSLNCTLLYVLIFVPYKCVLFKKLNNLITLKLNTEAPPKKISNQKITSDPRTLLFKEHQSFLKHLENNEGQRQAKGSSLLT